MRGLIAGCVLVGLLALPSAASAEKWAGKSRSVQRGVVETNADGSIKIVKLRYRVNCSRRGYFLRDSGSWRTTQANPIEQQGTAFSDSGQTDVDLGEGFRATGTLTLAGRFLSEGARVAVRHSIDVTVTRHGRQWATCKRTVRFVGRRQ